MDVSAPEVGLTHAGEALVRRKVVVVAHSSDSMTPRGSLAWRRISYFLCGRQRPRVCGRASENVLGVQTGYREAVLLKGSAFDADPL
jgi:hypothetical protein